MGRATFYCDECGDRIDAEDMDKGRAAVVDARPFCPKCLEESGVKVQPPPPQPAAPAPRTATARRPTMRSTSVRRRSRAPIVLAVVALACVAVAIAFVARGRTPHETPPVTKDAPAPTPEPESEPFDTAQGKPPEEPSPPPPPPPPARVEEPSKPPEPEPPPPPPPRPAAQEWDKLVDEAYGHYQKRSYAKAKELYLAAMPLMPAAPPRDKREAWWHYAPYNLATICAMEAEKLAGDEKARAHEQCRTWLAKSLGGGFTKRRCRCHGATLEHFKKERKFDSVRSEAWFKDLERSVQ